MNPSAYLCLPAAFISIIPGAKAFPPEWTTPAFLQGAARRVSHEKNSPPATQALMSIHRDKADWDRASTALRSIASLKSGWDGEGTEPISAPVIMTANTLLAQLSGADFPVPSLCPTSADTLIFEWSAGGDYAVLEFTDKSASLLLMRGESRIVAEMGAPDVILEKMKAVRAAFPGTHESPLPVEAPSAYYAFTV